MVITCFGIDVRKTGAEPTTSSRYARCHKAGFTVVPALLLLKQTLVEIRGPKQAPVAAKGLKPANRREAGPLDVAENGVELQNQAQAGRDACLGAKKVLTELVCWGLLFWNLEAFLGLKV